MSAEAATPDLHLPYGFARRKGVLLDGIDPDGTHG